MRSPKVTLTRKQISFIKENWKTMSNAAIAKKFKMNFSTLSGKLHEMGLFRMQMEYWTEQQIKFLKHNYKKIGDKEMAILFNGLWDKEKRWTWKHMEKKRLYLNLKRTDKEVATIRIRNKKRGCWQGMNIWEKRGIAKVGEIRTWYSNGQRPYMSIKTEHGFVQYSRWLYEKNVGPIPEGYIITYRDGNSLNVELNNLYAAPIGNYGGNRKKYPEDLIELEKTLKQFNQLIKQKL